MKKKNDLLVNLREGKKLSAYELLMMTFQLSIPAILAQLSNRIMQFIDASMVGHLGSDQSAAIGLVASTTWLFMSMCIAVNVGFTVQIAHAIGSGDEKKARNIVKQGLVIALLISIVLAVIGSVISFRLPDWLGATEAIKHDATMYFLVFSLSIPAMLIQGLAGGMLQCSGNMKVPSIFMTLMCVLDVVFNALFIFGDKHIKILGSELTIPGFDMGVAGAALGTGLAQFVIALALLCYIFMFSKPLHLRKGEKFHFKAECLKKAVRLGIPVGIEQAVLYLAMIVSVGLVVSPLGEVALAANSFAIIVESICYMQGEGICEAATTLVGQSVGAGRKDMAKRLANFTTGFGIIAMAAAAVVMYFTAPFFIGILTPDEEIRTLAVSVLRIVAFVEPLFGAAIVCSGVFHGAGDTIVPSVMNLVSMWGVRLPLSYFLAHKMGLNGVWIAMSIELAFRGTIFLVRLHRKKWLNYL